MEGCQASSPPPRPAKNLNLFISAERVTIFPPKIFEGEMGDLPILMSVNVGYDPEDPDPYMCHYESQEVMFAYKKDAQKRVLMRDYFGRTLGLPLQSSLKFWVEAEKTDMSMAQIVTDYPLPVTVCFARPECMEFTVDKLTADHTFFGALTVTTVYEEPYLWCLAIEGNGKVAETPIVLPRNLFSVCFCPVIAIQTAEDPAAKVKEFVDMYTDMANNLKYKGDPFFQDLAFVSRGPDPVEKVEPYICNTTFIPINFKRRTLLEAPPKKVPQLPPRVPIPPKASSEKKGPNETDMYDSLTDVDPVEHTYSEPYTDDIKPTTGVVSSHKKLPNTKTTKVDADKLPRPPQRKLSTDGDASGGIQSPRHRSVDLMAPPVLPPPMIKAHLKNLTVEDVAHRLKDLGLQKHAKKFRKNHIDGVLLQQLTEEHMKAEFKMNHTECLLLHTFITLGHIPQKKSSSETGGKSMFR